MSFGLAAGTLSLIGTAATVAAPIIGGIMGAGAASDGLAAQEAGAARSDATQRYMYDQNRADNAGAMARGNAAGNRLSYMMGLGGAGGGQSSMTADQYRAQFLPQYTRSTPGAQKEVLRFQPDTGYGAEGSGGGGPGVTIFTDGTSMMGEYKGPSAQATTDEAGLSAAVQRAMSEDQARQSSTGGDPAYGSLMRNFGPEQHKFGEADWKNDFVAQNGLQFGLDEGRKAIERQQSASGSALSGATLKAMTRFGVDYGTKNTAGAYDRFKNEYADRYNRFNTDQGNQFNRLSSIAGTGQTATGQVGTAGQNYANNVSQTAQGMGNAAAASGIAGSNAISGGIQGAYGNYQTNRLIDNMRGGSGINSGGYRTGAGTMDDLKSYGVF